MGFCGSFSPCEEIFLTYESLPVGGEGFSIMEYGFVIDPCWGFFGISSVCCVFLARLVELGGAGGGAWEAKCSDDSMGLEPTPLGPQEVRSHIDFCLALHF